TVRSLLDTREHCLNEFNFPDPYSKIKQKENDMALKYYLKVVKSVEELSWEQRQFTLVKGLLAGNVFDWGAKAVSEELLIRGTEVVLASNSGPALNDVTNSELQILTERIAAMDPVIHTALKEDRLALVQNGSSSPCLDLSRLDKVLATVVRERGTDLVIIEGMGRAIHTNYYAMLSCESLKLAVIKNSWLAERLGGKIFSVVFKYEVPSKAQG
ncbi:hypothetical protein cypCar_00043558, partial [Cyprinus carpio]